MCADVVLFSIPLEGLLASVCGPGEVEIPPRGSFRKPPSGLKKADCLKKVGDFFRSKICF